MDIVFGTIARIVAVVLLVGLIGGVGVSVYQAGFVAGAASEGATVVAPFAGYGYGWGFGHGFGFFGFLGTLLFFLLIFALLRAIFWRGPRGWGRGPWGYGHHGWNKPDGAGVPGSGPEGFRGSAWEDRAREVHDEWHRREGGGSSSGSSGGSSGTSNPTG